MLTLHETLLLFALHDDRGTVHSPAWVGLDSALRAAVVAEWMLRGTIEVRPDGLASWTARTPDSPLLDTVVETARTALPTESFEVDALLSTLESHVPGLRADVEASLTTRGAVRPGEIDRHQLEDSPTAHSASDDERRMLDALLDGLDRAPREGTRRIGILMGLVHVLDLWPVLVPDDSVPDGIRAGQWVVANDPICRATSADITRRLGIA